MDDFLVIWTVFLVFVCIGLIKNKLFWATSLTVFSGLSKTDNVFTGLLFSINWTFEN